MEYFVFSHIFIFTGQFDDFGRVDFEQGKQIISKPTRAIQIYLKLCQKKCKIFPLENHSSQTYGRQMKFTPEKETDEEEEIDVCEDTSPQQKNNIPFCTRFHCQWSRFENCSMTNYIVKRPWVY